MQEASWASTVATAAPAISIWKTKINSGSSIMFRMAPMSVVTMPKSGYPWAVIK